MKWFYDAQCVPSLNITNETGKTRAHSLQLQKGRARLDACSTNRFEHRLDQFCSGKICKYDFHLNIFDEQGIAFKLMFL